MNYSNALSFIKEAADINYTNNGYVMFRVIGAVKYLIRPVI